MTEIIGYIGTKLVACKNKNGDDYFAFRLAENHGKFGSENRKTNWYKVRASISRAKAARLHVRQMVKVSGRLDIAAHIKLNFVKSDRVPDSWVKVDRLLKNNEALAVDVVLLTSSVVPWELTRSAVRESEEHAA
jgi:hypothetical protein